MSKLYVCDALLEQLKCSICDAYLSIFPVNIKTDGSSPICGRCRIPNENDYFRDEGYEGIIQYFLFPCIHSKNGCNSKLTPLELKKHELCCLNRKLDCPSRAFAACKWQGANSELFQHFKDNHEALLLSDGKFELNFTTSIKENLLMPFEEEIFIVSKEIDSKSGEVTCSVEQVVQHEESNTYNYVVRVTKSGDDLYHDCPEKPTFPHSDDKVTRFNAEYIRQKLKNPAVIIVKILITKTIVQEDDESFTKNVEEAKMPEIEWDVLDDLKCPVCYEFMVPPIYQCTKGHSICNICKPQLEECPLCKGKLSDTQNFTLEKLTGRMKYPCKHHDIGCTVLLPSTDIKKHENSCGYGPYSCPLSEVENCPIKSNKSEIMTHIENNHAAAILKSDKINMPYNAENTERYYLIVFSKRIFKICFKLEDNKFWWSVQLVGPTEECQKFKFEIDIVDNSGNKLRQYIKGLCSAYTKHLECFAKPQNCICLLYEQISNFIDQNFTYRIRVLRE